MQHAPTSRARTSQTTLALAIAALVVVPSVHSQDTSSAAEAPTANRAGSDNRLSLDRMVVTGTGVARRKFDTSYAVSSLSASDIERLAPLNVADLLGQVPGVQAEATGGEAQNIYRVRGIPNESNFFTFRKTACSSMARTTASSSRATSWSAWT